MLTGFAPATPYQTHSRSCSPNNFIGRPVTTNTHADRKGRLQHRCGWGSGPDRYIRSSMGTSTWSRSPGQIVEMSSACRRISPSTQIAVDGTQMTLPPQLADTGRADVFDFKQLAGSTSGWVDSDFSHRIGSQRCNYRRPVPSRYGMSSATPRTSKNLIYELYLREPNTPREHPHLSQVPPSLTRIFFGHSPNELMACADPQHYAHGNSGPVSNGSSTNGLRCIPIRRHAHPTHP